MVLRLKQKPLIAGLFILALLSAAYLMFFVLTDSENKDASTAVGKNWEIEGAVRSKGQPEPKKNQKTLRILSKTAQSSRKDLVQV